MNKAFRQVEPKGGQMKGTPFGQLITAMVTPFDRDLKVDLDKAQSLARCLVAEGSQSVLVAGTTGESPTLLDEEKLELFRAVVDAVKSRALVIAGTGCNSTSKTIAFTKEAAATGIDGVLLVTPYYNRPSQQGLHEHFSAVAAATDLPVILYNVPGRTGRNIEAETTARLARVENIVAIKEASGDLAQIAAIRSMTPDDFLIYSGNDGDVIHVLLLGGEGIISVASHIAGPRIRQMIDAFRCGDLERARKLHFELLPLVDALFPPFSPNPVPVKMALAMRGIDVGGVRLPLVEIDDEEWISTTKRLVAELAPSS